MDDRSPPRPAARVMLSAARIWLPLLIAAGGIVMIALGHGRTKGTGATALGNSIAAGGVGLLIVAVIVWMINWLFRMSVRSNADREQEEAARVYFDRHGRWPDPGDSAGAAEAPGGTSRHGSAGADPPENLT